MTEKVDKKNVKKSTQNEKKVNKKVKKDVSNNSKKSLLDNFRIFCNGVKSEFNKVHWPSKKEMIKYSIATIVFIIFFALFFYIIEVIFALIQTLFN